MVTDKTEGKQALDFLPWPPLGFNLEAWTGDQTNQPAK